MISFIVCALGSFEHLLLGLLRFRTVEEMADGQAKVIDDGFYWRRETIGYRKDGKWEGGIETVCSNIDGIVTYKETGEYLDGKRMGKFVTKYYNKKGEVTDTFTECYFFDIKGPCGKSAAIETENESAYDILINKYPYFYRNLKAFHFEDNHVKSYIDSIGSIIDAKEYDVSEFDDNYDNAVDMLETGIFDSLWIMHDRLDLLSGLDELKQSQFRMAVIDHHRNLEMKTFNILQNTYPNYLKEVNNEGVGNADFEVFCNIFDSIMAADIPLDINNFFFADSIDVRLYRNLNIIYTNENYSKSENAVFKSAVLNAPKLLKELKEKYKNTSEKNPSDVAPGDVAGLVGQLMQKHYNHADKVRLAVREAYFKKGGMIDLPITGTLSGDTISSTSVNIHGNVLEDGGSEITGRGMAWATFYNPTVNDNYKESGTGLGEFTVNFEKLEEGITYYFRSYARNSAGVAYGNCVSFMAGETTGVEIIGSSVGYFTLFPNPATESLTIEFKIESFEYIGLSIFNLSGQEVYQKNLCSLPGVENRIKADISRLPDGIYNCRLTNNKDVNIVRKFLIAH